jgi:hypothetical protein
MAIEVGAPESAARVDGSLVYKGAIDAASPPDLTSAKKGDYYKISGAGTLAGVAVQVDDSIIFNQNASSPLTSAMFDVIDSSALGTASAENVGTSIGDVVQLENVGGSAGLPNVDGSQLQNVTATVADASETVKGIIEIATNVEAAAGTATDKALVASNVGSLSIASGQVTGLATVATSGAYADLSGTPSAATTTSFGLIELADNTEAASGTVSNRALTPANVGSLSIASGQITGLATVATSGAYADLSGTPTTATETTEGIIEISTNAEATAGTATDRALVPSNISSISVGQLSDVDLTGIAPNELLAYNSSTGNFEPTSPTSVPDASETVKGIIEIATNAEIIEIATNAEAGAGTATDKALVPSNVSSLSIASGQVTGLATVATSGAYADLSGIPTTATETTEGIIETATNVEAAAGTATDKALVPSNVSSLSIGSGQVTGLATVATSGAYADLSGTPTTATETTEGIIETATNVEAGAGTATDKALVPSNVSSLSIASSQVTGLGTAAVLNVGTSANNIVQLNSSAQIPAVDGSLLTDVTADAADVTSAHTTVNYTEANSSVDGHLSGIDTALGLTISLPTYSSIDSSSSPVTGAVNYHYSADTSSGAITLNLPAISTPLSTGQRIYVKLKTAGNNLSIVPNGSEKIDKQTSYTLSVEHSAITLVVGAGSNWEII